MSIINQIDSILVQIPQISGYSVKGLNYLLPFDTKNDIKNIFPGLLNELKDILSEDMGIYDSNRLCHILEHKFKVYKQIDSFFQATKYYLFRSLGLILYFPDELLANLLNLFYSILLEFETFTVKTCAAEILIKLLLKSKKIDKSLFKADWFKIYKLIDFYYYSKPQNCPGLHALQTENCSKFIEVAISIRRFFPNEAVDEILNEFEKDLVVFHSLEALRAARYISVLLPANNLSINQIERIFRLISEDFIGKMRRISTQFDIFIVYNLKRITKGNQELLKDYDWEPFSRFIFEQVLPSALKIPSPIKGAKLTKILSKSDVVLGEEFFEALFKDIPSRISKWIVYTMSNVNYERSIHGKLCFFLDSLKNLCHPSNRGSWTNHIEVFIGYICGLIAKLSNKRPEWISSVNSQFVDEIVEKVWKLSEILLFSKTGRSVTSFSCTNLANLRPTIIIPRILALISTSIESISEPHRTISAISVLQDCMANLLNNPSGIGPVISLLPTVVFGIDSNDQLKTVSTLSTFLIFAETAGRIENISETRLDNLDGALQEAKELTGQFPDIFLVFTENVISYLRSISSNASGEPDDILYKMITIVAYYIYSHLSEEIVEICLVKWLDLIEEDIQLFLCERIGEILDVLLDDSMYERLVTKLIEKVTAQIERGIGQLGSKDQSNKSFNNNLVLLSNLLETRRFYSRKYLPQLKGLIDKIMTTITNRTSFNHGSSVAHSIVMGLIHYKLKGNDNCANADCDKCAKSESNPFEKWVNWVKPKFMRSNCDFSWDNPEESDALMALEIIKSVSDWARKQADSIKSNSAKPSSKSEIEKVYCLLQTLDNLNIDLLFIYNYFSSYDYGINSELRNETIMRETCMLLKENLSLLKSLIPSIESIGNLELEIQMIEIIGSVMNGTPVNPATSLEKIKALQRNIVNVDRYFGDKFRPKSYWIPLGQVQFKFRRDLRYSLGDKEFENCFMGDFDEFAELNFKASLKEFHKIRAAAQNNLQNFIEKYPNKADGLIARIFSAVENNENLKESEFKGICFLLRGTLFKYVSNDFGLIEKYLRCLMKLSGMPVSESINDSFEILTATLSEYTDMFVPDSRFTASALSGLIEELLSVAEENSEKWTRQYLALLSAHPLIEMCHVPGLFGKLAKLSLSKVSVVRNISQNCFKSALFSYLKEAGNQNYLEYRGLRALDMIRLNEFSIVPDKLIKPHWTSEEKEEFQLFIKEYLVYLCLSSDGSGSPDSQSSDGSIKFEYTNFFYIGRWISLMGPEELSEFLKIVQDTFNQDSLDLDKQRAFVEIICAVICYSSCYDKQLLMKLMRKSWNMMAIEHLSLWTTAIDDILMWKEEVLKEIVDFFFTSSESSKLVLSIKMINLIFKQIGNLKNWINVDLLIEKLIKLSGHEYSLIVLETSNLLGTISAVIPEKQAFIMNFLSAKVAEDSNNRSASRAILQFIAVSSTNPELSNYWEILEGQLETLLKMLLSENVQLMTDAKKAILTLFLAKGCKLTNLNSLALGIIKFIQEYSNISVKISKFCLESIQLLLQNNFSLFHEPGSVTAFFTTHVDKLIDNENIHLRESSHGICLTLYQIDKDKALVDVEKIRKGLDRLKQGIKGEKELKERHSMVIRASAIILSDPRGIPAPLPALLTSLSYYISDRSPISPLVRTTFSEFRRTHQDTWQIDRQMFDEDQLDAIGELLIAPSYYA